MDDQPKPEPETKNSRPRRLSRMTIRAMAANVVTILALCAGMTSIRLGLEGRWEMAVGFIVIAGIFDALDGTVARLLRSTSRFGAELDSLSDVVSFGMAPAVVVYSWGLQSLERVGWIAALAYAVACALRLARFNSQMEDSLSEVKAGGFFTGVPAPAGAGLLILPMIVDFQFEFGLFRESFALVIYAGLVAMLMVSTLPTFSLKMLVIERHHMVPVLLGLAMFFAALTVYTWPALTIIGLLYLASLPVAFVWHRRIVSGQKQGH